MKWTANQIKALKGEKKIAMLTAYDALTASLVDAECLPGITTGGNPPPIDCGNIGMTLTVPDYTVSSGQGKACDISGNPELWGLDQYTWAVVT